MGQIYMNSNVTVRELREFLQKLPAICDEDVIRFVPGEGTARAACKECGMERDYIVEADEALGVDKLVSPSAGGVLFMFEKAD